MSNYTLDKVYNGYMVRKVAPGKHKRANGLWDEYLVSVKDGACKWCQDHTYARSYSLKTASKHIEALRKGEIA